MIFYAELVIIDLERSDEMLHKISRIITNFLISKEIIGKDEAEIYTYGYETLLSGIIDLFITIVLGFVFKRLFASIVYFVMFVTVRMYTGGYHADSYLKCKILFIIITISVLGISYIEFPLYGYVLILLLFLLTAYFLCPIENPNKPIRKTEKQKYRIIGLIYSAFWSIAAIITYFNATRISAVIVNNAFVITLLMIYGAYGKEEKDDEKEYCS
ncbi:MAG: accessory gene regulator B family protein [Ruminococcus flavefaciens]|nr:accessory gene regulator B family protein [Ruminococcus flavefaciens]